MSTSPLLRTSIAIAVCSVATSIFALINQLVLAHYFGAGDSLDSYLVGMSLPLTVTGVLVGALNYQLIPALAVFKGTDDEARFYGALLLTIASASAAVILVGIVAGLPLAQLFRHEEPGTSQTITGWTARLGWLALFPSMLTAYFSASYQLKGRFLVVAFVGPLPAIASITSCLAFHARWGILAIPIGQAAGLLIQAAILGRDLRDLRKKISYGRSAIGHAFRVIRQTPAALTALLLFSIYPTIDAFWAPRIGPSTLSFLGYGQRLIVGIGSVIVAGATTVVFPKLSEHATRNDESAFHKTLIDSLRALLCVTAPVATIVAVLSPAIIRLFFQRGAFTEHDTVELARLLPGLLVGMVAMCCVGVQYKALFARHDLKSAAFLSVAGTALYFVLSGIGGYTFGLPGFGVAYATTWWVIFAATQIHLATRTRPSSQSFLRFVGTLVVAIFFAGLGAQIGYSYFGDRTKTFSETALAISAIAAGAALIFSGIAYSLRLPEMMMVWRTLFQRAPR